MKVTGKVVEQIKGMPKEELLRKGNEKALLLKKFLIHLSSAQSLDDLRNSHILHYAEKNAQLGYFSISFDEEEFLNFEYSFEKNEIVVLGIGGKK